LIYALWHWGKSAEHQAARGQLSGIDLLAELEAAVKDYPNVPHNADLTNSPGTKLAYRLPAQTHQGWRLFGATAICLIWNAIVIALIVMAVRDHLRSQWDWGLDLLIVPFALGGGYLIYYFVRELLIATGIGPTLVEISSHPLVPQVGYQLQLTQGGNLTVNHLEISLHCEEHAAYRQGTDLRHDYRTVYHQSLFRREQFQIQPGQPFQADCEFQIPAGAMHSFQADHNEIRWTLVVVADAVGWPPFRRSFPIMVYPPKHNAQLPATDFPAHFPATRNLI
jgi:hypothetical protein